MRLQHGLIAGADLISEAQLPVAAARQERKGQRAALAADRDRLRPAVLRQERFLRIVEHRAERRDERPQRVDEPLRIGSRDNHPGALGDRAQGLVARRRFLALLLGKSGADDDCRGDAARGALLDRRDDICRRHQNDREIGCFGDVADSCVGLVPQHLGLAARHRIDAPVEAVLDKLLRQSSAQ